LFVAQAVEHRVADPLVARPFAERDLAHQHRLHPMRPLRDAEARSRTGCARAQRFQFSPQLAEQLFVESGAHVARVLQPPSLSCTPSNSDPMPVREPCGSVKPPITNSWRRPHFSLIQSGERRCT
jgi:hypothetical protein